MNTNDLVYKIAAKVKELADKPLPELRYRVNNSAEDSFATANHRLRHMTRGQLIEEIITEEFCVEFPHDIVASDGEPVNTSGKV